jgi:hypothetical protein
MVSSAFSGGKPSLVNERRNGALEDLQLIRTLLDVMKYDSNGVKELIHKKRIYTDRVDMTSTF